MPLTPTRIRILRRLAERDLDGRNVEEVFNILKAEGHHWIAKTLWEMAYDGLLTPPDFDQGHEERWWTITPQGRAALAAAEEGA